LPVLADVQLAHMSSFICGANVPDQHLTGVVWDRDVPRPRFADLRNVTNGEACARCASGTLQLDRGIEVGHVFKLGDTYTRAMNMTVLDADGKARVPLMGCYGIGVSRIVAAAIEQNNDENGILWPMPLAPFHVHLLLVNPKQGDAVEAAEHLEAVLVHQGVEVLVDDRDERLGVKFKDADLLGIPVRIVVGGRSLKEGAVEIQERRGGEAVTSPLDEAPGLVMERLRMLGF
jgi:prolyl-tRNA synthetase